MNRQLLIRGGIVIVMLAVLGGAWQVAYARGRDDGTREATAIRTEFGQARPPAAAGSGDQAAGAAAGASAGQAGGGGGGGGAGAAGRAKPGGAAGGQFGSPAATGTIEKVEGNTLMVATSDGTVKVTLGERTQIRRQVTVAPSELKSGERVVVSGERSASGEVTASAIQLQGQ